LLTEYKFPGIRNIYEKKNYYISQTILRESCIHKEKRIHTLDYSDKSTSI